VPPCGKGDLFPLRNSGSVFGAPRDRLRNGKELLVFVRPMQ
jgi:hypothetical protein